MYWPYKIHEMYIVMVIAINHYGWLARVATTAMAVSCQASPLCMQKLIVMRLMWHTKEKLKGR